MSAARVLNPVAFSRNLPCGRQLNRIKRDLFGPANPSETNRIFAEEVEKQQESACKKWGFDFRAGLPLQCNAQFVWERVSFPESTYTPEMYTLTRAAHVRPTVAQASTLDLLMDERAERENSLSNTSASSATDTDSCTDDDSLDEAMPMAFKLPKSLAACSGVEAFGRATATKRRQPKITEYMKERKRLAQAPKKFGSSPPAKRMRTTSGSSTSSIAHYFGSNSNSNSHSSSISMHLVMQRRSQQP